MAALPVEVAPPRPRDLPVEFLRQGAAARTKENSVTGRSRGDFRQWPQFDRAQAYNPLALEPEV